MPLYKRNFPLTKNNEYTSMAISFHWHFSFSESNEKNRRWAHKGIIPLQNLTRMCRRNFPTNLSIRKLLFFCYRFGVFHFLPGKKIWHEKWHWKWFFKIDMRNTHSEWFLKIFMYLCNLLLISCAAHLSLINRYLAYLLHFQH